LKFIYLGHILKYSYVVSNREHF